MVNIVLYTDTFGSMASYGDNSPQDKSSCPQYLKVNKLGSAFDIGKCHSFVTTQASLVSVISYHKSIELCVAFLIDVAAERVFIAYLVDRCCAVTLFFLLLTNNLYF